VKKPGNIFSDGQSLLQIFCQKDVSKIFLSNSNVRLFFFSQDTLLIQNVFDSTHESDCLVKLSNTKFRAFGFSQFEEELYDEEKRMHVKTFHMIDIFDFKCQQFQPF
jgi:hypothetical protein